MKKKNNHILQRKKKKLGPVYVVGLNLLMVEIVNNRRKVHHVLGLYISTLLLYYFVIFNLPIECASIAYHLVCNSGHSIGPSFPLLSSTLQVYA